MAEDDHGNLEPPKRSSIDDPGAHELEGKISKHPFPMHFTPSDIHINCIFF